MRLIIAVITQSVGTSEITWLEAPVFQLHYAIVRLARRFRYIYNKNKEFIE